MMCEESASCRTRVGPVLIVEDNEAYGRIASLRLRNIGLECHVAGTHETALRVLREHTEIRVAVIDYDVHGIGPAGFVKHIRKHYPDLKLIGHSNLNRRGEFAALGVHRFLWKPWTPENLLALLVDSSV